MAKQPTVEQLDQLHRDLAYTARNSAFAEIRQVAHEMVPNVAELSAQLKRYRLLVDGVG